MVKYYYDNKGECFRGTRGKPLYVNSSEAHRIANMVNLGYTTKRINKKVTLSSTKSGRTTVENFVKHYKKGEIKVPQDIQANIFEKATEDKKVTELENRIKGLEKMIAEMNKDDESEPTLKMRLKEWLNR